MIIRVSLVITTSTCRYALYYKQTLNRLVVIALCKLLVLYTVVLSNVPVIKKRFITVWILPHFLLSLSSLSPLPFSPHSLSFISESLFHSLPLLFPPLSSSLPSLFLSLSTPLSSSLSLSLSPLSLFFTLLYFCLPLPISFSFSLSLSPLSLPPSPLSLSFPLPCSLSSSLSSLSPLILLTFSRMWFHDNIFCFNY